MGVGATQRASAVKWGVATQIVWAWILTIPVSFAVGALLYQSLFVFRHIGSRRPSRMFAKANPS